MEKGPGPTLNMIIAICDVLVIAAIIATTVAVFVPRWSAVIFHYTWPVVATFLTFMAIAIGVRLWGRSK